MRHDHQNILLWIWSAAILAGIVLLVSNSQWSSHEPPVYQGKTLFQWIDQLDKAADLHPADSGAVASAQSAIRAMGTNALPFALENLHAHETLPNKVTRWLANRAPFLNLYPKNVAEQWALGVQVLDILGPIAAPCLRELVAEATNNPGYSEEAMLAVGAEAVPAFINLLQASKPPETVVMIRAFTATMSIRERKSNQAVLPVLKELSQSKDRDTARAATEALKSMWW